VRPTLRLGILLLTRQLRCVVVNHSRIVHVLIHPHLIERQPVLGFIPLNVGIMADQFVLDEDNLLLLWVLRL